jgi:hypothetical protein
MIGYKRSTLRAVVDALVPETSDLAARQGQEHEAGAVEIELETYLANSFDNYQELHLGPLSPVFDCLGLRNVPFAIVVSLLLDFVALELLLRQDNEDSPTLASRVGSGGGVFARLSPRDRLRAMALLEDDGVLPALEDKFGETIPQLGAIGFLSMGLHAFPLMGYYSEWAAEKDVGEAAITPEDVQGWQQAGYPGPEDGYAKLYGYEIDEFRENEY